MPLVVAGDPGTVAAGRLAPLLARVFLDEVADAARRRTGPLTVRDSAVAESLARLEREPDLVAPGWTLYTVRAESVEFWQGDAERRHTRLHYRRDGGGWRKELLWP